MQNASNAEQEPGGGTIGPGRAMNGPKVSDKAVVIVMSSAPPQPMAAHETTFNRSVSFLHLHSEMQIHL